MQMYWKLQILCQLFEGKTCFHYRFFPVKKNYTGKTLFSIQGGFAVYRKKQRKTKVPMVGFIYILDSSNSSSFTFWSSQFASSSRSYWTGIWTSNSNGSWTDKHSSHFSTAKAMSVKATLFFILKPQQMLKWCWNVAEILLNYSFANDERTRTPILELNW